MVAVWVALFQFMPVGAVSRNVFDIKKYGAKGDGKTINTAAINKAIDACAESGGGTVIVSKGVYLTGTIEMKSHISLYLEEGSVIKGTSDLSAYKYFYPEEEMIEYNKSENRNGTGL